MHHAYPPLAWRRVMPSRDEGRRDERCVCARERSRAPLVDCRLVPVCDLHAHVAAGGCGRALPRSLATATRASMGGGLGGRPPALHIFPVVHSSAVRRYEYFVEQQLTRCHTAQERIAQRCGVEGGFCPADCAGPRDGESA